MAAGGEEGGFPVPKLSNREKAIDPSSGRVFGLLGYGRPTTVTPGAYKLGIRSTRYTAILASAVGL